MVPDSMIRYEILPVCMKTRSGVSYLESILSGEPDTWIVFKVEDDGARVWIENCISEELARKYIDKVTGRNIVPLSRFQEARYEK